MEDRGGLATSDNDSGAAITGVLSIILALGRFLVAEGTVGLTRDIPDTFLLGFRLAG